MEGLSTLPMMDELQAYGFLMVLLRITGLTVTAPVLGSLGMPMRVRGALAFSLSLALYPLTEPLQEDVYLLGAAICELMYGLTMGFLSRIIWSGIRMAGEFMGANSGLALATVFDPQSAAASGATGRLLATLSGLLIIGLNLDHGFILALADSFRMIPPGINAMDIVALEAMAQEAMNVAWRTPIMLAAPVTCVVALLNAFLAISTRLAPSMNIYFGLGIGSQIGLAMGAIFLSLPHILVVSDHIFMTSIEMLADMNLTHSELP